MQIVTAAAAADDNEDDDDDAMLCIVCVCVCARVFIEELEEFDETKQESKQATNERNATKE